MVLGDRGTLASTATAGRLPARRGIVLAERTGKLPMPRQGATQVRGDCSRTTQGAPVRTDDVFRLPLEEPFSCCGTPLVRQALCEVLGAWQAVRTGQANSK